MAQQRNYQNLKLKNSLKNFQISQQFELRSQHTSIYLSSKISKIYEQNYFKLRVLKKYKYWLDALLETWLLKLLNKIRPGLKRL